MYRADFLFKLFFIEDKIFIISIDFRFFLIYYRFLSIYRIYNNSVIIIIFYKYIFYFNLKIFNTFLFKAILI